MAWIFIDTHERGRMRLASLPEKGRIRERVVQGRVSPVVALARLVRPQDQRRIRGVCVVKGPGPFSVIRAGVLVANVIARTTHVPLVGISVEKGENLSTLRNELLAGSLAATQYVAPIYDAEPNISSQVHRFTSAQVLAKQTTS